MLRTSKREEFTLIMKEAPIINPVETSRHRMGTKELSVTTSTAPLNFSIVSKCCHLVDEPVYFLSR